MGSNAAQIDTQWELQAARAGAAAHLESNKWLADVFCTSAPRPRRRQEPVELEILGKTILWTVDRDRPFPEWLLTALAKLVMYSKLETGWDSYGGRPLQPGAVAPVLTLLVNIHQIGRTADVVPLPDGGVGLRLADGARSLEIDISAQGTVEALLEGHGDEDVLVGPEATAADAEQILGLFVTP